MIREADRQDLALLLDWRMEVLAEVFAGESLETLREKNRVYYENELGRSHIACFALEDGKIIGCGGLCLQTEMPSPDNPSGICGYLMNIYVRKPYRRQGHAAQIVKWLCKRALDHQAGKIWLETSDDGRPLYETLGFSDLPGIMKRQ